MIRMTVEGVGLDHFGQTVVVLRDGRGVKLLPIWIGAAEARSIQMELEKAQPPRPLSHDLLLSLIAALRGHITRIVINDLLDATFYATIDVETPAGTKHLDARPSDAIALAVRARCPIFVDGSALEALVDANENIPDLGTRAETENEDDDDETARFRRLIGE